MKRIITVLVAATVLAFVLVGCASAWEEESEMNMVMVPVIQPGGTVVMQPTFN